MIRASARARVWGWILVLAAGLALAAPARAADSRAEAEIRALLKGLAQAYAAKDMDRLLAAAAPEALVEVEGPLGLDRRAGRQRIRAAYEPDLKAAQSPSLTFTALSIEADRGRALVRADLLAGAWIYQRRMSVPARLSARLEKRAGHWRVVSAHLRYPLLAGDLEGLIPWSE